MNLHWIYKPFSDLTTTELYSIIQLRNEVFVIEQNCVYQDADGKDPKCFHLMGMDSKNLAAYVRIIPPGISYTAASIGRVVTAPAYRKTGIGKLLMQKAIELTMKEFNANTIQIGAQCYLQKFYIGLGFVPCSPEYLEDGIPHIEMRLEK